MPLLTLKQKESIILPFDINNKKRIIAYIIEATQNVKVFIMNDEEMQNFEKGISLDYIFKSNSMKYHEEKVRLPFGGRWYIVVSNLSKNGPTTIHYEVYT